MIWSSLCSWLTRSVVSSRCTRRADLRCLTLPRRPVSTILAPRTSAKHFFSRLLPKCKARVRPPRRRVLAVEQMEGRLVPSTITWVNEFDPSNQFAKVFGNNADLARRVTEAAVDSWAHVITDFHTSTNAFSVTIIADPSNTGQGGGTQVTASENGIPTAATIDLGTGPSGDGAYLFLDPNVPADPNQFDPVDASYLGANQNAFAAKATNDTGLRDLYTLVAHELGHALGFSGSDTAGNTLRLATTSYSHDVSNPPGNSAGDDYVFQGPSVTTLLTSDNGGTSNAGVPIHADYYD